jgi:hypothetical protein
MQPTDYKDPIVEEVIQVRRKIAEECGFDFRRISQRAKDRRPHWPAGFVSFVKKPSVSSEKKACASDHEP